MAPTYSAYEAKARFSELLRQVQKGLHVRISYRGREVAELRPLETPQSTAERLSDLESRGILTRSGGRGSLAPIVRRKGALARFLDSRD